MSVLLCMFTSCTCIDSYTNNTVCKHIHLIQMKASETEIDISGSSSMTISMESDLEYYQRVTSFGFPTEKKSLSGSVSDKSTLGEENQFKIIQYFINM